MSITLIKQPSKKTTAAVAVRRNVGQQGVRPAGGGVVSHCVHGATGKSRAADFSPSKLIAALRVGLPVRELDELQASLGVPMEKLFPMLGISKATFHRRKTGGRLDPGESDRVVRFARLLGQAVKVFGDLEDARLWITSPQFGLGGAVPLDYAQTEIGAREVENLLGRIEYGVYS